LFLSDGVRPGTLALVSYPHGIPTNRVLVVVATLLWLGWPLAPGLLADSTADEKVQIIRSYYDAVEKDLSRCQQVKRDLMGESAEGGELTAYFLNQSLRKLVAKFYGETGQTREEYYFWDDRLFFVLRVESRYDKPFGKVVSKKEERFYFADGALIRWLDPAKKEVSVGPEMQERGGDFLARAKKYMALAKD
jgi:hypothetical protein